MSARYFEDGDASACVVVGARSLVIEMTTESDLFVAQARIGSVNSCGRDIVEAGMFSGAYDCMQPDFLSTCETGLKVPRLLE